MPMPASTLDEGWSSPFGCEAVAWRAALAALPGPDVSLEAGIGLTLVVVVPERASDPLCLWAAEASGPSCRCCKVGRRMISTSPA